MTHWLKSSGLNGRQMLDMPPIWLMGFIALVWLQASLLPFATVQHWVLTALGALLFWGGIALMVWTILTFRAHATSVVPHQQPRHFITSGPFARSRNPIYLGDLLVLAGVILNQGAWPCLILLPLFAAILVRRFIAPEEVRLKQCFDAEFDDYAQKTPRWL